MSETTPALTPMMKQYLEAKAAIPADAVLLFRLGDFYEEFFEDAEKVSRALDLVLTRRQNMPMCGFPYHALDTYLPRLINAGIKVAIAEQMEDPKSVKRLVKREITRIVTPGTVVDGKMLDRNSYYYLTGLRLSADGRTAALAALDVSIGEFFCTANEPVEVIVNELIRLGTREVLIPSDDAERWEKLPGGRPDLGKHTSWTVRDKRDFEPEAAAEFLCRHFNIASLDCYGYRDNPDGLAAAGAVLRYATESLRQDAAHITEIKRRRFDRNLELDHATIRNLELVSSASDAGKDGTLLGVIDATITPMGGRHLKNWLLLPSRDVDELNGRYDSIAHFLDDPGALTDVRELLGQVRDLERICGRICLGTASVRDLLALKESLRILPELKTKLLDLNTPLLGDLARKFGSFSTLVELLEHAINAEDPGQLGDGKVFKTGYYREMDELRALSGHGKDLLSEIQQREISRTGIKSLKVRYNSVFGYYIEVSKANLDLVPFDYVRKQTLVNAERFITPELKELESKILGAEERIRALELELFKNLCDVISPMLNDLKQTADALGDVDVLSGLADVARRNNYCRPEVFDDQRLVIERGRHPVLERLLPAGEFVPNDTIFDGYLRRMMVITGPNMAGKSTYIRQVGLIVIMAQLGSFVPADRAQIGLADRIFTRVGAADDLTRNQSTFMVEMVETANILRHATPRSLVIMDEVGRGTSTYDGLAIAWSVAEFLHDDCACRTLFATHYHELTELAITRRGVNNFNVKVEETPDGIVFLRQIVPGPSDRSYGIYVAKLAGVPDEVLKRAGDLLKLLEDTPGGIEQAILQIPAYTARLKRGGKADPRDGDGQLILV